MNTVGIIAEYNPFHLGHANHVKETRSHFGKEAVIVAVMSGDFVQRGEAAVFSKFARAEAACRNGVDLVLELPLPWSVATAERFSEAAVRILSFFGGVNAISFGSECGDIGKIEHTAKLLLSDEYAAQMKTELSKERHFAKARMNAVQSMAPELAEVLREPNNILAVEYAKAKNALCPEVELFTVKRTGADHDQEIETGLFSAKALRERLKTSGTIESWRGLIPDSALDVYDNELRHGRGPVYHESLEQAILARLRFISEQNYQELPDAEGGIGNALYRAVQNTGSLDQLQMSAKNRNITLSRIRRMILCAALGIRTEDIKRDPSYVRILACNEQGRGFLHETVCSSQIVTKPAQLHRSNDRMVETCFELGAAAHDLYVLGYSDPLSRRCGEDWVRGPYIA